jgi:hypothetical protein
MPQSHHGSQIAAANGQWAAHNPVPVSMAAAAASMMRNTAAALAMWIALAGCAGDGIGLDETGSPTGEILIPRTDPAKADSLLRILKAEIFTPICSRCHFPYAPPYGLSLDSTNVAAIVGRPSRGVPGMTLVVPGDPAASYLLWKLTGRKEITGFRMPMGGPYLADSSLRRIRSWINCL